MLASKAVFSTGIFFGAECNAIVGGQLMYLQTIILYLFTMHSQPFERYRLNSVQLKACFLLVCRKRRSMVSIFTGCVYEIATLEKLQLLATSCCIFPQRSNFKDFNITILAAPRPSMMQSGISIYSCHAGTQNENKIGTWFA